MKMKKIAAVLTTTALGVSLLAGCGGKKAEELVTFYLGGYVSSGNFRTGLKKKQELK